MVLLVQRLCDTLRLSSKLDRHHQPLESEVFSASLRAFRSHVSNCLAQLFAETKPGSQFSSLRWIHQCLEVLSQVNKALAKLVIEIDHPMSKWEQSSIQDYLNYSLRLLELLNLISSSHSRLGQARLGLSHALTLVHTSPESAIERLRAIELKTLGDDFKEENKEKSKEEGSSSSAKELVLHQALMVLESTSFRLCGIVISGLSGDDINRLPEMKDEFNWSFGEKKGVAKEVNDEVEHVAEAIATGESSDEACKRLEMKLEEMQSLLDSIGKETDGVFSDILAARDELLDGLRQTKH